MHARNSWLPGCCGDAVQKEGPSEQDSEAAIFRLCDYSGARTIFGVVRALGDQNVVLPWGGVRNLGIKCRSIGENRRRACGSSG